MCVRMSALSWAVLQKAPFSFQEYHWPSLAWEGGERRSLREQISWIKQYHRLPHPRMSCLPGFITLWAGKMGFEPLWVSLRWGSGGRLERVVYGAVRMFSFLIDDVVTFSVI